MLSSVISPDLIRGHARVSTRFKVGIGDGRVCRIDLADGFDCKVFRAEMSGPRG
jgi:hypothetical protein